MNIGLFVETGYPLHSWQFQRRIDDSNRLQRFSLGNWGSVQVLYNWLIYFGGLLEVTSTKSMQQLASAS